MNPKNLSVRLNPENGDLVLFNESTKRRVANITNHVYNALASELVVQDNTKRSYRDIKFADGKAIRITIEEVVVDEQTN